MGGFGASGGGSTTVDGAPSEGSTAVDEASGGGSTAVDGASGAKKGGGNGGGAPAEDEEGSSSESAREGKALPSGGLCNGSSVRMHSSPASLIYTPHLSLNKLSWRFHVPRNSSSVPYEVPIRAHNL